MQNSRNLKEAFDSGNINTCTIYVVSIDLATAQRCLGSPRKWQTLRASTKATTEVLCLKPSRTLGRGWNTTDMSISGYDLQGWRIVRGKLLGLGIGLDLKHSLFGRG